MKPKMSTNTEQDMQPTTEMLNNSGPTTKMDGPTQIRLLLNEAKAVYVWNKGLGHYVKADIPALIYSAGYLLNSTFEKQELFDDSGEHVLLIKPEDE